MKAPLAELSDRIAAISSAHRPAPRRCPTGLARLDAALGGGLVLGAVHELGSPVPGALARMIALRSGALAAGCHGSGQCESPVPAPAFAYAPAAGGCVLFVDAAEDFYPPGATRLGIPPERLLVVRAAQRREVLWVCEQALRCRAIAAVIAHVSGLDVAASRRLQLAAEAGGGLGLLIGGEGGHGGPTLAASRLWFEPLVTGRVRVRVLKLREAAPVAPFEIDLFENA